MKAAATGGLVAILAVLAPGCTAQAVPDRDPLARSRPAVPPGGALLVGAGATFPSILYNDWFGRYHAVRPETVVAYDAVGSGEGVRRFVGERVKDEDLVDFGASDAAMTDEEMDRVPEGAVLVPVTAGSIAIAYNLPGLTGDLRLSRQAYTGIFLGKIRQWNDPIIRNANPGVTLPNLTIATVVRQEASGTTFAFTKHLDAASDLWRAEYGPGTLVNWPGNAMRATGNEGVAGRILQSTGSVGYVGYEFARRAGLRVALVENRAGNFVAPSALGASSAFEDLEVPDNLRVYVADPVRPDAYPVVTLTWILVYRHYSSTQKAEEMRRLLRWCLTDGQQYAEALGYAPLPPTIRRRSVAVLDGIRGG